MRSAVLMPALEYCTCRHATWGAARIGRFQYPINVLGTARGGNVRTGLEDNLLMDDEKRDQASNERLVRSIAAAAQAMGRSVATPQQARQMLGLPS